MLRFALGLVVGAFAWGAAFSDIVCPDGNVCPNDSTCCKMRQGYGCCPFPQAVCCSDLAHCCPSGYRCNLVTQMCEKTDQPWMNIPMVEKEEAEEQNTVDLSLTPFQLIKDSSVPEPEKVSYVHCDNIYTCPDGTTCCRHPAGAWFCCPYSPGRCCLDGFHCCPYGYDCDLTYQHCVRKGLQYPFASRRALSSVPASLISPPDDKNSVVDQRPMAAQTEAFGEQQQAGTD